MLTRPLMCIAFCLGMFACSSDDDPAPVPTPPATNVHFVPSELPYQTLSEYNFFTGELSNLTPQSDVLPYDLITPLFTDYTSKKRFVWFMPGKGATYNGDHEVLEFDDGAVIIKNFYYEQMLPHGNQYILETRLLYKLEGEWHFAEYVWNEEQTEAHLDMEGSFKQIEWIQNGVPMATNYRIPSSSECLTCHKTTDTAVPIGPKPQNLNMDYPYSTGVKNQLARWAEVGYIKGSYPVEVNTMVAWNDPLQPLELRVRAYLDMNCASCHRESSHCDYRPMRFAWSETTDRTNQGVCVPPDEEIDPIFQYIIAPGNTARSVLHHRLQSNDEAVRMPLLGRTVVHQEAVDLITQYILSLTEPC